MVVVSIIVRTCKQSNVSAKSTRSGVHEVGSKIDYAWNESSLVVSTQTSRSMQLQADHASFVNDAGVNLNHDLSRQTTDRPSISGTRPLFFHSRQALDTLLLPQPFRFSAILPHFTRRCCRLNTLLDRPRCSMPSPLPAPALPPENTQSGYCVHDKLIGYRITGPTSSPNLLLLCS